MTPPPRSAPQVTRNKLSFRDDLPKLLLESEPLERNLDRKFRDWLARCHAELDRSISYERPLPASEQAASRRAHGEATTLFERCVGALPADRSAAVRKGDLLWLRVGKGANAQIAARCAGFIVPQAAKADGPYPGGRVLAVRLPELVHGSQPSPFPVGRILGACSEAQAAEFTDREMARAPARVKLEEPLSFSGGAAALPAGSAVPEMAAKVLTAAGQAVTRTLLNGQKAALTLVQTLYYLGPEPKEDEAAASGEAEENAAAAAAAGASAGKRARADPETMRDVSNLPEGGAAAEQEGGGKPRKRSKGAAGGAAAAPEQPAAEAEAPAEAPAEEAAAAAKGARGKGKGKKAAALLAAAEQAADTRQMITQARTPATLPQLLALSSASCVNGP